MLGVGVFGAVAGVGAGVGTDDCGAGVSVGMGVLGAGVGGVVVCGVGAVMGVGVLGVSGAGVLGVSVSSATAQPQELPSDGGRAVAHGHLAWCVVFHAVVGHCGDGAVRANAPDSHRGEGEVLLCARARRTCRNQLSFGGRGGEARNLRGDGRTHGRKPNNACGGGAMRVAGRRVVGRLGGETGCARAVPYVAP